MILKAFLALLFLAIILLLELLHLNRERAKREQLEKFCERVRSDLAVLVTPVRFLGHWLYLVTLRSDAFDEAPVINYHLLSVTISGEDVYGDFTHLNVPLTAGPCYLPVSSCWLNGDVDQSLEMLLGHGAIGDYRKAANPVVLCDLHELRLYCNYFSTSQNYICNWGIRIAAGRHTVTIKPMRLQVVTYQEEVLAVKPD